MSYKIIVSPIASKNIEDTVVRQFKPNETERIPKLNIQLLPKE